MVLLRSIDKMEEDTMQKQQLLKSGKGENLLADKMIRRLDDTCKCGLLERVSRVKRCLYKTQQENRLEIHRNNELLPGNGKSITHG